MILPMPWRTHAFSSPQPGGWTPLAPRWSIIFLVTEEMDAVNLSRVREGHIHAERPQIVTPQNMAKLLLEGFGDQGQRFAEQISEQTGRFAFLKYGFRVSKSDIRSYDVHESLENVAGKLKGRIGGQE